MTAPLINTGIRITATGYIVMAKAPECVGGADHTWDNGQTIGRCMTKYTCLTCGLAKEMDSSD